MTTAFTDLYAAFYHLWSLTTQDHLLRKNGCVKPPHSSPFEFHTKKLRLLRRMFISGWTTGDTTQNVLFFNPHKAMSLWFSGTQRILVHHRLHTHQAWTFPMKGCAVFNPRHNSHERAHAYTSTVTQCMDTESFNTCYTTTDETHENHITKALKQCVSVLTTKKNPQR